ncbi:MAG TPA: Sec-independent protein translocase protein TatB [Xanthobacteraceae bacterium]|nr:Sec-independent protein translocase protein TatB [Xanthobacteraceae bacterium]
MFDISWTEFLLIGIVALVFIGPKELPGVMRTLGQYTRKIRSMAAEFQGQFQEAMREAEMADLKKSVDDLASDIKNYDPLKSAREDVEAIGRDLNKDIENKPLDLLKPQEQSDASPRDSTEPPKIEPVVAEPAGVEPVIAQPSAPAPAPEPLPLAAEAAPAAALPEPAIAATPESTERTG